MKTVILFSDFLRSLVIYYYDFILDSSFLLANAQIVEFPIVYCNEEFSKTSGFNRAEVYNVDR